MNPTKSEYDYAKAVVTAYESEQKRLAKYTGKSICPFCSGTKTKPFVRSFRNQNCTDCDKDGNISNRKLAEMGLDDVVKLKH